MKTENKVVGLPDYDSDVDYSEVELKIDDKLDIMYEYNKNYNKLLI